MVSVSHGHRYMTSVVVNRLYLVEAVLLSIVSLAVSCKYVMSVYMMKRLTYATNAASAILASLTAAMLSTLATRYFRNTESFMSICPQKTKLIKKVSFMNIDGKMLYYRC